jgi:hypothetical protein
MRTAVFDTIKSLQPYFYSLREVGTMGNDPIVSLDIRIPIAWRIDTMPEGITLKIQDKNEHHKLISLVSPNTKEGYDAVFTMGRKIIKVNQEEEEKLKLFEKTVGELKTLFLSSSLDKLKDISFTKSPDGIRNKKGDGEIKLGTPEGPGDNGSS